MLLWKPFKLSGSIFNPFSLVVSFQPSPPSRKPSSLQRTLELFAFKMPKFMTDDHDAVYEKLKDIFRCARKTLDPNLDDQQLSKIGVDASRFDLAKETSQGGQFFVLCLRRFYQVSTSEEICPTLPPGRMTFSSCHSITMQSKIYLRNRFHARETRMMNGRHLTRPNGRVRCMSCSWYIQAF